MRWFMASVLTLVLGATAVAEISTFEFQTRRKAAIKQLPDGILLVHAQPGLRMLDQSAFHQDATFYYFTGLDSAVSAILAIDGAAGESWLFVPSKLSSVFGTPTVLKKATVPIGFQSAALLKIEHVADWNDFIPYIDRRLKEDGRLVLYTDEEQNVPWGHKEESNPAGMAPLADRHTLWRNALLSRWPNATLRSAANVITELRRVKSEAEIAILRRMGERSAAALLTGMRAVRPGRVRREIEAEIVRACNQDGGDGHSFWPEVELWSEAFLGLVDYHFGNRALAASELIHLDLGCEVDHYAGDVTRMVPVSGKFQPDQREAWDLVIRAFRAGMSVMRDGATTDDVNAAFKRSVEKDKQMLRTPLAKNVAEELTKRDDQLLHGAGLECCEPPIKGSLRNGMVVVLEPGVEADGQFFHLEDMLLVTKNGVEVLTAGLPYTADEIERVMADARRQ